MLTALRERISIRRRSSITSPDANGSRLARRRVLVGLVYTHARAIRLAFIIVGYIWMLLIPHEDMGRETYVDENALMQGQVNTGWDWDNVRTADRLLEQIEQLRNASSVERAEFIRDEFEKIGIPSATQSYSFDTTSKLISGVNTYASYAAPRASGAEAVIVSASWNSLSVAGHSQRNRNERGLATLLSLAAHVKQYSLWAKNFVFVVDDGYLDGMHAFLSAYHGFTQPNMYAEPLKIGSGGVVWTAICIDYPGHSFSHLGIFYEGVNGRLPNQDLLNSVQVISRWTGGVPVMVYNHPNEPRAHHHSEHPVLKQFDSLLNRHAVKEYEMRAKNILTHVAYQSRGSPSGVHGLFHQFRIDALTLYAVPAIGPHGFHSLGKVLESTLRTTNNLLERLHASYFFYLLTGPGTFVQIGKYLTAAVLVGIGMELEGLKAWVDSGWILEEEFETHTTPPHGDAKLTGITAPMPPPRARRQAWRRRRRPVVQALALMIATHLLGWVAFVVVTSPLFVHRLEGDTPSFPWAIAVILQALPLFALFYPDLRRRLRTPSQTASVAELLHSFTLCIAGMTICIISVLNFSLAAVMAVLTGIPLSLGTPRRQKTLLSTITGLFVFSLLMPPGLLGLMSSVHGAESVARAVGRNILEWELFGVWFTPFVCIVYLPLVLQAWLVYLLPS